MAVAALVVSMVAIIVAGAVGVRTNRWYGRLTAIEEERRVEEQRPQLELEYSIRSAGHSASIRNRGPIDLDGVHVETIETPTLVVDFQRTGQGSFREAELGPLRIGQAHDMLVEKNPSGRGGDLRLRVTARAADRSWTVLLEHRVPSPPRIY